MARFSSFDEFEAGFPLVAAELLNTGRTDWNGRVEPLLLPESDPRSNTLGVSTPEGTVLLHDEKVRTPIREAFEHRGDPAYFTERRSEQVRGAVAVTLHEGLHLASASLTSRADAFAETRGKNGYRAMEEGATELATVIYLDAYIDRLGLDEVAPGIQDVVEEQRYLGQMTVLAALTARLADATGRDQGRIIADLASFNRADKYSVVADLAYQAVPERSPAAAADPAATKAVIASAMRNELGLTDFLEIDYGSNRRHTDVVRAATAAASSAIERGCRIARDGPAPTTDTALAAEDRSRSMHSAAEHVEASGGPAHRGISAIGELDQATANDDVRRLHHVGLTGLAAAGAAGRTGHHASRTDVGGGAERGRGWTPRTGGTGLGD